MARIRPMSHATTEPFANRQIRLTAPPRFDLEAVVHAHGWWNLPPFRWDEAGGVIATAAEIDDLPTDLSLSQPSPLRILVEWTGAAAEPAVAAVARRMLMLDSDLAEFQRCCARPRRLRHVVENGLGRLLRAPTLWEDVVKVLCTTNVNWGGTRGMSERLVKSFGARTPLGHRTFPSPQRLARRRPATLAGKARLGYRAGALSTMARAIVAGELDLAAWEDPAPATEELLADILTIKGLGPYAAASILALVERYDFLPVDSVFMNHVTNVHFKGERPTRAAAERVYRNWGRWKYLAYWFER